VLTDSEPTPSQPAVTVIEDIRDIDESLPRGQLLVEVFSDGQVHVAYRERRWDRWSRGVWTIDNTPTS